MRNNYTKLFHLLLLLSLLVWNLWVYLHRNEGFAYKEFLSYNSLYYPSNDFIIKDLKLLNGDSARIQLIATNNGKETHLNFDIHLKEGRAHYSVPIGDGVFTKADLGLDYTSVKAFKQKGSNRPAAIELFYSTIPAGTFKRYSVSDWQYSPPFQENELKEAEKLISEKTGLNKKESELIKIQKIATFLIGSLNNSRGLPLDSIDHYSAMKRFNYALTKKSKVWCGDFASILALFLKSEGIPSRLVCTEGKVGDLNLGGHSMNEVYVKELKKWILVDLTSKAIFVKYNGSYLNTLELYALHQNQVQDLEVMSLVGDSLKSFNYHTFRDFYSGYFTSETQFIYYFKTQFDPHSFSFGQKWKRYFFSSPTFATYAGTYETNNFKFYTKQMAFVALCLYLVYCLFLLALKRNSKHKQMNNSESENLV